jgi:hypothetical protein
MDAQRLGTVGAGMTHDERRPHPDGEWRERHDGPLAADVAAIGVPRWRPAHDPDATGAVDSGARETDDRRLRTAPLQVTAGGPQASKHRREQVGADLSGRVCVLALAPRPAGLKDRHQCGDALGDGLRLPAGRAVLVGQVRRWWWGASGDHAAGEGEALGEGPVGVVGHDAPPAWNGTTRPGRLSRLPDQIIAHLGEQNRQTGPAWSCMA